MTSPIRIGILAGEASGDILGEGLIKALNHSGRSFEFVGIGGPKMIQAGLTSLFDMEEISVMGFIDPLLRIRKLLSIRKALLRHFLKKK